MINDMKSAGLSVGMAALTGFIAYIIAGKVLAVTALVFILMVYMFTPSIAPGIVLKFYRGRRLNYSYAPELHRIVRYLSSRAGLESLPELYYIPSKKNAAFATGNSKKSAVAMTAGMLNTLTPGEIAGVLGHELSHIRNNDMRVMWFALTMNRVTGFLSLAGQLLLFVNLPLILFSDVSIGWLPIAVLVFAPTLSYLVQLTISRVREFNADLGSAELTGSPEPLISALTKIEYGQQDLLDYLFFRKRNKGESSLLSTHPPTEERIRRLKGVRAKKNVQPVDRYEYPTGRQGMSPVRSSSFMAPRPGTYYYSLLN